MSLFDEMMKNEEYRKMFDQFPDDQKPIIMERIRILLEDTENKILIPMQNVMQHVNKK